jgi:flagellar hook-associated protein 2
MSTLSTSGATATIAGLASNLDTTSIINQLMALEAQPQNNLKTKLSTDQTNITSLQDLNTTFSGLAGGAQALADITQWNPMTVTSSDTNVSATASTSTVPGSLTFTVGALAAAHQIQFTNSAALTDTVANSSTMNLTIGGKTQSIDVGSGSLGSVIAGLNATGTGVKASTIKLDDGSYRLQVTSTTTGAASQFTLTNTDGSSILGGSTVNRLGADAAITIGTDTLHSSGNTFTSVANGLTLTLGTGTTVGSTVTLNANQDVTTMSNNVQQFVNVVNAALDKVTAATGYNASTQQSGALSSYYGIGQINDSILSSVLPTDGTSLASVGIQLDRYGHLVFDPTAFQNAYAADPSGTAAKFIGTTANPGLANRIATVATAASDPVTGTITTSINSTNSEISDLKTQIADWDVRLAAKQAALQTTYTNLETSLSQLNSQSSWLTSQINSLNGTSSSSKSS